MTGFDTIKNFRLEDGDKLEKLPSDITGKAGKVLSVNSSEDGFELQDAGSGDMRKMDYDTTNTGIVDNSEKLGNKLPTDFLDKDTYDSTNSGVVDNAEKLGGNLPTDFEKITNRGQPNGYAPLGADGIVLQEHLPDTAASVSTVNSGTNITVDNTDNANPIINGLSDDEIKTAYESNDDTNAYTDADKSKLSGINDISNTPLTLDDDIQANKVVEILSSGNASEIKFITDKITDEYSNGGTENITYSSIQNIGTNKYVHYYQLDGALYYQVITIDGDNISYSDPISIYTADAIYYIDTCIYLDGKILVIFRADVGDTYDTIVIVGTIDGDTITHGDINDLTTTTRYTVSIMGITDTEVLWTYNEGNSYRAVILSIDGDIVTENTYVEIYADDVYYSSGLTKTLNMGSNGILLTYGGYTVDTYCVLLSISSTDITLGTQYVYNLYDNYVGIEKINDNKFIILLKGSNVRHMAIGNIDGGVITFSNETDYTETKSSYMISIMYVDGFLHLLYRQGTDTNYYLRYKKFSENLIELEYVDIDYLSSGTQSFVNYIGYNKLLISYNSSSTTGLKNRIKYVSDIEKQIGLTQEAGLVLENKNIALNGGILNTTITLIPGLKYYLQDDGTISDVYSKNELGRAINTSQLKLN